MRPKANKISVLIYLFRDWQCFFYHCDTNYPYMVMHLPFIVVYFLYTGMSSCSKTYPIVTFCLYFLDMVIVLQNLRMHVHFA